MSDVQHKYKFEDINKTAVLPYHWETHSREWPSIVKELIDLRLLSSHGEKRLSEVKRGDKDAVLVAGTVDRMLWYYGFKDYYKRILELRSKLSFKN